MADKATIYQVLPRFWGNGRFSAWDDKTLGHLAGLGFTHIWFTGVIRHASCEPFVKGDPGCPYAISDYYDINPYLADEPENRISEFDSLVSRTHSRGLKLIIDFVPNHVARNYADTEGGIPLLDRCDYDWTDTLKIDYSNPSCYSAMVSILRYWAGKGIDGFRCDMVELVPLDFFTRAIAELKAEFPDLLFIGEVYSKPNYRPYIKQGGFDLLYDKSGSYDILRSILTAGQSARLLTRNWQELGELQPNMLNFLENHDEQRTASDAFLGSADKAYAAFAFCALFNDASVMVYAGQETGENASESSDGRTSIFNATKLTTFGKPVLSRYGDILTLAGTPLFREGRNWDLCYCNLTSRGFNPDCHFAFLRYLGQEACIVVCNFSDTDSEMEISLPPEFGNLSFNIRASAYDMGLHKFKIQTSPQL